MATHHTDAAQFKLIKCYAYNYVFTEQSEWKSVNKNSIKTTGL